MENQPSCPACGAPSTVTDLGEGTTGHTVAVTCVAHHAFVGPRDLLAPRLRWDVPSQPLPIRDEQPYQRQLVPVPIRRR